MLHCTLGGRVTLASWDVEESSIFLQKLMIRQVIGQITSDTNLEIKQLSMKNHVPSFNPGHKVVALTLKFLVHPLNKIQAGY